MEREAAPLCRLTEDQAREFLEKIRWPSGACCPKCGSVNVKRLEGKAHRTGVYKCREKECRKQFTVTVGTIFQGSKIALRDWVYAFNRMCASKKGVSALQLKRELGLNYRSAWFLCHRIRHAMAAEPLRGMLQGTVEMDETYVGGKPRDRRSWSEIRRLKAEGKPEAHSTKVPVVALVVRGGNIRTRAIAEVKPGTLRTAMRELLEGVDQANTVLNSDESRMYERIGKGFKAHRTVHHARGEYHRHSDDAGINTAESFFGLFKRGLHGAFHHVSKRHLQRYADEFSFRWNHRKIDDRERTVAAIKGAEGRRLSYRVPSAKAD
jgi:transposase-like protein